MNVLCNHRVKVLSIHLWTPVLLCLVVWVDSCLFLLGSILYMQIDRFILVACGLGFTYHLALWLSDASVCFWCWALCSITALHCKSWCRLSSCLKLCPPLALMYSLSATTNFWPRVPHMSLLYVDLLICSPWLTACLPLTCLPGPAFCCLPGGNAHFHAHGLPLPHPNLRPDVCAPPAQRQRCDSAQNISPHVLNLCLRISSHSIQYVKVFRSCSRNTFTIWLKASTM